MSRPENCHQCVLLEHVKGVGFSHPKTFRYGCLVVYHNYMLYDTEKVIIGDCLTTQELRDKYCIYDTFEKESNRIMEKADKIYSLLDRCR